MTSLLFRSAVYIYNVSFHSHGIIKKVNRNIQTSLINKSEKDLGANFDSLRAYAIYKP